VQFVFTRDPSEFAERAMTFLGRRLERNIIATVTLDAVEGDHGVSGRVFVYGLDDEGEVIYAGLRTPPWYVLTSDIRPALAATLVERWLAEDPILPGVDGPPEAARAIAAAWRQQTGGTTELRMSEAMHALDAVIDPDRPAPGMLRPAAPDDRDQLIEWAIAFDAEARMVGETSPERAARTVDARIRSGMLHVWDDGGPVSFLGVHRAIAGAVRIGPVYTPPALRRRGYASTAVAAASRCALERGARQCTLFTDLSNPTSNKIYAEVGYRRCGEWEEHDFHPPG
jgi:RimJ/RimL family protein N-acetyltransferase